MSIFGGPISEPVVFKYRAFISYSHADTRETRWLHQQLEGFHIDRDLVGRATATGPIPKSLRPIFRDRDDFTAGHTLSDQTLAALDASAALVVVCSPAAAKSAYVNGEIRLFKARHPDRPVIPIIIAGRPSTSPPPRGEGLGVGGAAVPVGAEVVPGECFPPALRFLLDATGAISASPAEVLAADIRDDGDGRALAVAKVVARLLDLDTDDIFRRAERERRRRSRNWITGLSAIAVSLAGLAGWAEVNRREAVAQRQEAEAQRKIADERRQEAERNFALAKGAADGLVFDIAQGLREVEGMRAGTVAKILGTARKTFDKLAGAAPNNLELQRSRSVMLNEFGATYQTQGNLPEALKSYHDNLAIDERLARSDPGNAEWQRDLSVSHVSIGDVLFAQGDLPGALEHYRASFAIRERLAKSAPDNARWQHDFGISNERIGNVQSAQGDLAAALKSFEARRDIISRLATSDTRNSEWHRDLSVSYGKVGDVLRAQGNLPAALESHRAGLAVAEQLATFDAGNAECQRDLSVSYEKAGDILVLQRNFRDALESYRARHAIAERLAKSDAGNAGWQRDLATSFTRLAYILDKQGNRTEALADFRQGQAIMTRLTALSPDNATWKKDAAFFAAKIAELEGR